MPVTAVDIQQLEAFADRIFANVGIDVEFTKHFKDRVNSERNAKPIVPAELTRLFKQERKRYGKPIAQMGPDSEAVMRDLQTDINVPFALVLDKDNDELDLIAKTVMRKKDFDTPNRVFAVEDSPFRIGTRYEMPRSTVREEVDVSTERGRLEYYLKKPTEGKVVHLGKLGKFHDDKDELVDYVPQRNGRYALHPDKWESTFYSLTNKDLKKVNLYRPAFIDPPAGTIVADMAIANQFYRTDDEEEKIDLARRYEKSIVPFGSNISHIKMPEVIMRTTVSEGATKKHPKEPGAYLMTHNGLEYKISKFMDPETLKHKGEWKIEVKGASAFSGDNWEWVDTVSQRWNAIARVKGLTESNEKKPFDWITESRAYRTPRQLNVLTQKAVGEQLFEQLLALQIFVDSDPLYAARIAEEIMKLQNWPGFRTSQPDLYNIIAIALKPEKFKDRIKQDVTITIPELRLKRNLRNIMKRQHNNSDYSYMMLMLQRQMEDFLPAPLIQMRRQISNWDRQTPRDKNTIRQRLMLQMRKTGLQNEFYEFLRRSKNFTRR